MIGDAADQGGFDGWHSFLAEAAVHWPRGVAGCIGLIRRDDYARRGGTITEWRFGAHGAQALSQPYSGELSSAMAVLLVADATAIDTLRNEGLAAIASLVRRGAVLPYILKTMGELEEVGLADFVEDLGLVFPKH